jgi:hypothetical protein
MNFAPIIVEKGEFTFEMKSCANIGKKYTVSNCSLTSISESINLDGNATVDFNYVSSLNNQTFIYFDTL